MTGWNLPPGCNVSDIPGNRPEDEAAEALWDTIADILTLGGVDCNTEAAVMMIDKLTKLVGDTYGEGYQTGGADAEMAQQREYKDEKQELVDAEIVVPCVDGTENHKFVISDENENVCYCERCGCVEY
jgi:hypothetical protein